MFLASSQRFSYSRFVSVYLPLISYLPMLLTGETLKGTDGKINEKH